MLKEETLQLKGVAILMMLWLHLFSNLELVELCNNTFSFVNGKPFIYALTRITSCCVHIYIFLGGYGLATTYQKIPFYKMNNGRRALSLMINFWIVFSIFIPIGCYFNPSLFIGSISTLLLNISGIIYTYNGAWWFLLPYVLLTIVCKPLIRTLLKKSIKDDVFILILLFFIHIGAYIAKDYPIPEESPLNILLTIVNFLFMLFFFSMGVIFVKYKLMQKIRAQLDYIPQYFKILILIFLCFVKMLLGSSSLVNLPFVLILIPLLISIKKHTFVERTLIFFGTHSTNMWLTHYFFCHYIFGNLIYQLYYPAIIYICLISISLASSYLIQYFFLPIKAVIRK